MHRYGWSPDTPDHRDFLYRPPRLWEGSLAVPIPPTVDPRSALSPIPIFDQGQLGSCTANGTNTALEVDELKQGESVTVLSRLFTYWNTRSLEGTIGSDAGASIRDVVKAVAQFGSCPETEWPYDASRFTVKPPARCYQDAVQHKAILYQRVNQDVTSMKSAIAAGRGIVLGISVYASFESDTVAKTGIVPLPGKRESLEGGHCVYVCGFTDVALPDIPAQYFIARNSWGADWGLRGYFAIPYAYLLNPKLCSDLWVIQEVA